jgi:ankyrin repeat protein
VEVIRLLAGLGADLCHTNNRGATPVFVAAQNGHVEVIRVLAELGADVNSPNNVGATPVFMAAMMGHVEAIRVLAELGADVNSPDTEGVTPVLVAAQEGHFDVLSLLVELNADVDVVTDEGESALVIALGEGHEAAVSMLVSVGADVRGCVLGLAAVDVDEGIVAELAGLRRRLLAPRASSRSRSRGDTAEAVDSSSGSSSSSSSSVCLEEGLLCALFSFSKLMSSAPHLHDNDCIPREDLETLFAAGLLSVLPAAAIEHMRNTPFLLRRRLVCVAHRVHQASLLQGGERLAEEARARRYTELACFLLDASMLRDVLSLRLTCKSNSERRRFPVCYGTYRELEANIVEEWLGCGRECVSRFVGTGDVVAVLAMYA